MLRMAANLALVTLLGSGSIPGALEGRLIVDQPIHDAGTVEPGALVRHGFVLRNGGDAELRIVRVVPACGCTVASFPELLEPGVEGQIDTQLDTRNIGLGPFQKTILVESSDRLNPRLTLTLRGEVRRAVTATPSFFRWPATDEGTRGETLRLEVHAERFADLQILALELPGPWLEATFREAPPAERPRASGGRVWLVEATLGEMAPSGPLRGAVMVRTNHPDAPVLELPLSGYIRPRAAPR